MRLSNRLQILTVDSLVYVKMLCSSLKQLDVDAAAQKYIIILREGCRSVRLLNNVHKKVSQVELGLLKDGVGNGEPDCNFNPQR